MPSNCLSGIRILLVEDHASLRSVLRQFLLQKGATVTTCGSASDGADKVRREQPELVLTDLNLPDADGFQLMTDIRKFDAESGRNTPVLAMSALGDFVADDASGIGRRMRAAYLDDTARFEHHDFDGRVKGAP